MHPETDIAREFWVYVTVRGHGDATSQYPWPDLVVAKEWREFNGAVDLGQAEIPDDAEPIWTVLYDEDTGLPPRAFPTLQEALYDYLLAHAGDQRISLKYDVWLRAVAHIMADVVHDPTRLVVKVAKDRYDHDPVDHAMVVSNDWSVLLPHTFKYVSRAWRAIDG